MNTVRKIEKMKSALRDVRSQGMSVGFIPTMGYLHEGHLSLVKASLKGADCTVVSIFVNPTQFGPKEDLEEYPRDLARDSRLLEELGVDFQFCPDYTEMYPPDYKTYVEVEDLQDKWEGLSRPGHFRGVCTVVLKLFNIVRPDVAFFGQKDAQQAIVLKRMVSDFNLDVRIEVMPTVREEDGLALSSRNVYLNPEQRQAALCLSRSLNEAVSKIRLGERRTAPLMERMREIIDGEDLAKLDYIAIVDTDSLGPLKEIKKEALIALAVYFGSVRLIDNIMVPAEE
ncbi:MAG TPA: pantoate--beta-alanine ligase [Candidatus Heimdallarchaeota archaeon]|nr:pantoate--beta-alanine ligase [Candidatus Heimdallarchaeota archaeon]